MTLTKQRIRQILIGIIILGAVLRILFLVEISRVPFFYHPVADARIYVDRAMDIYHGKIFPESVSFHSSPIYPYFIAATYAIGKSLAAPRIVQAIAGLANVVVVFLIASSLFNPLVALLSAFWMSVYPIFIYFEGDLMMIPLVLFTLNLSCLMFVRYQQTKKRLDLALGGVFLGLSAMGKPDTIMIAPFMALFVILTEKNIKQGLLRAFMLALWVTVSIAPVTLSNFFLLNDAVLLTSNGGVNFYIGNHHEANGMFHLPQDSGLWDHKLYVSSKEVAEQSMGMPVTPSQVSKFWFGKGTEFIVRHPFEFVTLTAKKIMLMISRFEVSNHHSFYFFRKWSSVLAYNPLRLSLFVALAVVGIWLSLAQWRRYSILYIYLGVTFWIIVLFFVTSRYRLPTVPFYLMFASFAMYRLFHMLRDKEYRRALKLLIPAVVVYALTWIPFPGLSSTYTQDIHNMGNVYMSIKEYDKALRCYRLAIQYNSRSPFNHYNIGNVYMLQGKTELAIAEFLQEIELNPEFTDTYVNLGQIYMKKGNFSRALEYFNKAIELEFSLTTMINIGYIQYQLGNVEKAIEIFEHLHRIDPSHPSVIRNLAICYDAAGNPQKAQQFRNILK